MTATVNLPAIAPGLTQKIHNAERRCDDAVEALAELLVELKTARRRGGLCAEWTQPVLARVSSAIGNLSDARGDVVGAHKEMSGVCTAFDFEPFTGDNGPKPGDPPHGMVNVTPLAA